MILGVGFPFDAPSLHPFDRARKALNSYIR